MSTDAKKTKQPLIERPKRELRNDPTENKDLPDDRTRWKTREFVVVNVPDEYKRPVDRSHEFIRDNGLDYPTHAYRVTCERPDKKSENSVRKYAQYECFAVDATEAKAFTIQTYGIPTEEAYRVRAKVVRLDD